MTLREAVSVPWSVANYLFEKFAVGPVPDILSGSDLWIPPESRGQFEEYVEQELAKERLLSGSRLRDDFHDALSIAALPGEAYSGWVESHERGRYAVQLARTGRDAVLLLRRGAWVSFAAAKADDLARGFLAELPEFWFNDTGKAITLPESEAPWSADGEDTDEPPANRTAMRLRDLLRLERYGGGQLQATRTRGSTRRRAAYPLNYIDNTDGRWVTQVLPGDACERHVIAFPAHPGKVRDKLGELLTQVT